MDSFWSFDWSRFKLKDHGALPLEAFNRSQFLSPGKYEGFVAMASIKQQRFGGASPLFTQGANTESRSVTQGRLTTLPLGVGYGYLRSYENQMQWGVLGSFAISTYQQTI